MVEVAVFHRIGEPTEDKFTHSIEQILAYEGKATFDGVYDSVYEHRHQLAPLEPILFITGDQIGQDGFCAKEQLQEMESMGFTLGWHGKTHKKLTELRPGKMYAELNRPDWVGPYYAYPHGDFNDQTIQALRGHGYAWGYSTTQGDEGDFSYKRIYI